MPTPSSKKLASMGSPLDRIRIVAGGKAKKGTRRDAEVGAESDLLTVSSWMSAGSAGIGSTNITAFDLARHTASPPSATVRKVCGKAGKTNLQLMEELQEEEEEELMELHVLKNLSRLDEEEDDHGVVSPGTEDGQFIKCGECPPEEEGDEDEEISAAKDLTATFEEQDMGGMIQDAIENTKAKASSKAKGHKTSLSEDAAAHRTAAHSCFSGIVCGCALSKARGGEHCLMKVSPTDLLQLHNETYGAPRAPIASEVKSTLKRGVPLKKLLETQEDAKLKKAVCTTSLADVTKSLHKKYWDLAKPAKNKGAGVEADSEGRVYDFKGVQWQIAGVPCCRHMWELAVGGSPRRHRTIRSLVMRGYSPSASESSDEARKIGKLLEKVHDAHGRVDNEKRGYAANWWKTLYLMCDYMPNEERIQIKGPSYAIYHRDYYGPVAKKCADRDGALGTPTAVQGRRRYTSIQRGPGGVAPPQGLCWLWKAPPHKW